MISNRAKLYKLLDVGLIDTRRADIFNQTPSALPDNFDFRRVEGMMLGLAIGDSLGNTSESMTPHSRFARYGEIKNYLPNRHTNRKVVGLPSDDTQLAYWALEQMISDRGMNPEHIVHRFARQQIFGIGGTVSEALTNIEQGVPWEQAGVKSAGNGAIMRIAPVIIPHLNSPSPDLWIDTALLTFITHNDSMAIASAVAYTAMLWELLQRPAPPEPCWYLEKFVAVARDLEVDYDYIPETPNAGGYRGGLSDYCQLLLPKAWEEGWSVADACDYWNSGAYLMETVPSVLYILMRWGHDPQQAIIRAVNDTWDNDTIAAIVGAAVGALYGKKVFPRRWMNKLTGRTGDDDDGRICGLLKEAREVFWK